jgi:hypothetical protein
MALKIMLAEQEEEQRKWHEEEEEDGGRGADAAKGAGAGQLGKMYTMQMECQIQVAAA